MKLRSSRYIRTQKIELYAGRHGYHFYVDNHMWVNKSRPIAWSKLLALRERLNKYKWVMWMDLDTVIMNMDTKLEDIVDDRFDVILTKDNSGLNSGVMLWRNTTWSRNFLLEAYNQDQFLSSTEIYEQRAIIHVLNRNQSANAHHVKYLPQEVMNSYSHYHSKQHVWKQGEFIVHLAGCRFVTHCKKKFAELYQSYISRSYSLNKVDARFQNR